MLPARPPRRCSLLGVLAGAAAGGWVLRTANSAPAAVLAHAAQSGRADRGLRGRRHAPRLHPERRPRPPRREPTTSRTSSSRRRSRSRTSASTSTRASTTRASSAPRSRTRPTHKIRAGRLDADDAARPHPLHAGRHARGHRGLQAQDPRGAARARPRGAALQGVGAQQVPQHRPVRHGRRPDGDRRRRRRAAVLQQARAGPDAARGGDARRHAAGALDVLAGGQPERHEARAATRSWARWPSSATSRRQTAQERDGQGPRAAHGALLRQGPRALRARLREVRADQGVRPRDDAARRLPRLHDDRPQATSAGRARRSRTTWPASGRRRRSSRSTRRTATSSRWPPRYGRTASRSSTSPPRATASPAPRSRRWR